MKKILMAAALLSLASISTFAATLSGQCGSPVVFSTGAGGPVSVSCPSFTIGGGNVFYSLTLELVGDYSYTGPSSSVPNINETYTYVITAGGYTPVTTTQTQVTNQANQHSFVSLNLFSATAPVGTVSVSASNNTGQTNLASLQSVFYTYTYDLPQNIPEPSTVALIGAGLVGVASIARRRR